MYQYTLKDTDKLNALKILFDDVEENINVAMIDSKNSCGSTVWLQLIPKNCDKSKSAIIPLDISEFKRIEVYSPSEWNDYSKVIPSFDSDGKLFLIRRGNFMYVARWDSKNNKFMDNPLTESDKRDFKYTLLVLPKDEL